MATDMQVVKDADIGLVESLVSVQQGYATNALANAAAAAVVNQKRQRMYRFYKTAADAMASTATAETATPWLPVEFLGKVAAVFIHPTAALTGDPTNNATINVFKRDAAGANQTAIASLTTTASWVAGVRISLATSLQTNAANLQLVLGGSLTITITKGGTGVVVPICMIDVIVEDN